MTTLNAITVRHIELVRGDCLPVSYRFLNVDGSVKNLTGYGARFAVRTKRSDELLALLTDAAGLTLGGAAGTVTGEVAAAVVLVWDITGIYYELALIEPAGCRRTQLRGDVLFMASAETGTGG